MQSNNTKPNISHTKLFKQVSEVLGSSEALRQLNIAYKSYKGMKDITWDWEERLVAAFNWEYTEQCFDFWCEIDIRLDDLKINSLREY